MPDLVEFDAAKKERFRKAYNEAVKEQGETSLGAFTFEGGQYLIRYAKYLLEYLDMKIKG